MNRHERRARVKRLGGNWRREQQAKRASDLADRTALQMSPAQARAILGEWAALRGHTQAEVDALNAEAGGGG